MRMPRPNLDARGFTVCRGFPVQFRRCLQQQGVYDVSRRKLVLRKDTVDPTKCDSLVYRIAFECGKVYIGETEKPV